MRDRSIHDFDKRLRHELGYLDKHDVLECNRALIHEFVNYQLANGMSKARIARYVGVLRKFSGLASKSFRDLTKPDVVRVVGLVEGAN
ncbi:MAG TPA: hypothetical protein VI790_05205 [Candidatus Nanoarchaeia archaeon]|nr:hypothetical protein [Candidatus Nanoarchaeia archaeon]